MLAGVAAFNPAMIGLATMGREPQGEVELRALSGDPAAWEVLVRRHDRRVVVFLLARRIPADRARELAHETWIRLIEQQRRGALSSLRLPALALAQAAFLATSDVRRRTAGSGEAPGDEAGLADPSPSPEERLASREQLANAERALSSLGPRAQEIFRLAYGEPYPSHAELAQRLGISVQRVRQTLCEVRQHLRAQLEEEP